MTSKGFNSIVFDQLQKKYGLIVQVVETRNGSLGLLVNTPAGDFAHAGPPSVFKSDQFTAATAHLSNPDRWRWMQGDVSHECAQECFLIVGGHNKAVQDAAQNTDLSGDGRAKIAVAATMTAVVAIAQQYAALKAIAAGLDTRKATLFAAPEASAADAIVDSELRQRFHSLAEDKKLETALHLNDAKWDRLLLALQRSPWPYQGQVGELIGTAWTTHIAAANQSAVIDYQFERDNNDWALSIATFLANIITNPGLNGTNGAIDEFEYFKAVRDTGGVDVLNLSDGYVQVFERRVLEAAA